MLQISEYARADYITVFIWVNNPYGDKHIDVFVDTPGLFENPDMPPIQITQPTVTPPPPPPTNPQPTARPVVKATTAPEPTQAPTQASANEPTLAPTTEPTQPPTQASANEPTLAPTRKVSQVQPTVRPTRKRSAASTQSASEPASLNLFDNIGVFVVVGLVGLGGAVVLFGAAAFLLLRRK